MASTNKTSNLGLNQWVLTDPLLMEDMNADNRKIDAAVTAATGANYMVKLLDTTLSANAQQVDLDLSAIDLTKFSMITVLTAIKVAPLSTATNIHARINGAGAYVRTLDETSVIYRAFVGSVYPSMDTNYSSIIGMEIKGIPESLSVPYVMSLELSGSSYYYSNFYVHRCLATLPMSTNTRINTINFITDNSSVYIKAGARFEVYGVRK